MTRPLAMLLGTLAGCTGGGAGGVDPIDFRLQLRPLTPLNQPDLFEDVASLTLGIDRGGELELVDLGAVTGGGSVESPEVAALEGAPISLYGHDSAGALVAYGRSSAWDLPADGDDMDVPVLVARVDAVGALTDLPGNTALAGGQLVATGDGRYYTLGGDERGADGTDDAVLDILRFSAGRPNTNLSFVRLGALPATTSVNDTATEGYAGHTATLLTASHDFQGWVLIAGGAGGMVGASTVTEQVALWNPETEELVTLGGNGQLPEGTFHHTADEFGSGYVALLGGAVGRSSGAPVPDGTVAPRQSAALFEPRSKTTEEVITGPDNGPLIFHDAATVDDSAVLACGGLVIAGSSGEFEASDRCDRVDADAVLTALSDGALPLPLMHHDMTALPDGRVLLTGGFTTDGVVGEGGSITASDEIWVYSSTEGWGSEPIGHLEVARGLHSVALLPDGKALVIGGSTNPRGPLWAGDGATGCAEIVDPIFGDTTPVGTCSDDVDGPLSTPVAMPMVAADPDHGVLVVGGLDGDDDATDQVAIVVAGIPDPTL